MSRFKGKDAPRHAAGYTFMEMLFVVAFASGLCVSLMGLLANNKRAQQWPLASFCQQTYWHTQQVLDEQWMFGESHEYQCESGKGL